MMKAQMFCFQCEQTAGCKGCTGAAGVCGKKAEIAGLQDQLTGALVGLARATSGNTQPTENTYKLLIKGLFTTITNVNFNEVTIKALIDEVHAEKEKLKKSSFQVALIAELPAAGMMITTYPKYGMPTKTSAASNH